MYLTLKEVKEIIDVEMGKNALIFDGGQNTL
jgi:hypothetical protein